MKHPMRGRLGLPGISALILVLALVAGACASSSSSSSSSASSGGSSTGSPTFTMPVKDDTIAAEVPSSALATPGEIVIATDPTYAPNEFVDPQTHEIVGMDVDLGNALAAVMGLKATFVKAGFDAIIPGLAAGKYDLSMASFTDTKEREATVDFVTYFSAGTSFYTAPGGPTITGLGSLCGVTVGVENGTTQKHDSQAQSQKCTAAGKQPVTVNGYPDQNGANLALAGGKVQVVMADSPVAAYAVQQSNGQFVLSDASYGTAPYGIAIPRPQGTPAGQAPLSKPFLDALKKLMADGTYQAILAKWGEESGAISNPVINGAIY